MSVKPESVSQSTSQPISSQMSASFSSLKQVIAKIEKAEREWESYVDSLDTNPWLSFTQPILANLAAYKLELDNLPNDAVVIRERGYAMIKTLKREVEERGTESSPLLHDSYGDPDHAIYKKDHQTLKQLPAMQQLATQALQMNSK
jgi:hypothetical protein